MKIKIFCETKFSICEGYDYDLSKTKEENIDYTIRNEMYKSGWEYDFNNTEIFIDDFNNLNADVKVSKRGIGLRVTECSNEPFWIEVSTAPYKYFYNTIITPFPLHMISDYLRSYFTRKFSFILNYIFYPPKKKMVA